MKKTFVEIVRQSMQETDRKFSVCAMEVRAKRPDLFKNGGGDVPAGMSIAKLLRMKPGASKALPKAKKARAETIDDLDVSAEEKAFLRKATALAEQENIPYSKAARRVAIEEFEANGGTLPPGFRWDGSKGKAVGASPIPYGESGGGGSDEISLLQEARALAEDEGIKVTEAIRKIRNQ